MEFETVAVDLDDEIVTKLTKMFIKCNYSDPSIETFEDNIVGYDNVDDIFLALGKATFNEIVCGALGEILTDDETKKNEEEL